MEAIDEIHHQVMDHSFDPSILFKSKRSIKYVFHILHIYTDTSRYALCGYANVRRLRNKSQEHDKPSQRKVTQVKNVETRRSFFDGLLVSGAKF